MRLSIFLTLLIVAAFAVADVTHAQTQYNFRDPNSDTPLPAPAGPDGNWNLDDNWYSPTLQLHFIPDYSIGAGELARVENGGTAYVDVDGGISPGQIILGSATGTSGTLEIRSGGVLASRQGVSTNGAITVGSGGGTGTLRVLPGGTLSAEGALAQGAGSGNLIVVGGPSGGTATLNVSTAVLPRTVQLYPNANFSTNGGANFGVNANLISEVTGNGVNGQANIGTTVTLAGNLTLNFNSYTPLVGHNWNVLEAGTINGKFAAINSNAQLAFNHNFVVTKPDVGGGREALNVAIAEVLVLEVNRNTGAATITHPGNTSILLDGYYVGSGIGSLNPGGRVSVNNQGSMGNNWVNTDATTHNVGELKPTNDGTIPGGNTAQISLGTIYNPYAGSFGQLNEDLEFAYRRSSDGTQFNGVVRYTGTAFNTLLLQVDPTGVGDAYLRNTSNTTVQIDAYDVLSGSGSLSTSGWNSLADQNHQGANVWVEVASNANQIGEFNQSISSPFLTLSPGASLNLGPLFNGGTKDLAFSFLMVGEEDGRAGAVLYEAFNPGAGLPGDYNGDGRVDAADYTVWRNALGQNITLPNEVAGVTPGVVTIEDYTAWKQRYGNVAPGAGGGSLANVAVPEPAACLLACMAALAMLGFRRPMATTNG